MLTRSTIEKLKGPIQVADTIVPGLAFKVTADGKRTFVLRYNFRGQRILRKLGDYGVLTLDTAREIARDKLLILARGKDPFDETQELSKTTWSQFWPIYAKNVGEAKKDFETEEKRFRRYLEPVLGKLPIVETTPEHILQLKDTLPKIIFNRMRSLISVIWRTAMERRIVPLTALNPTANIKPNPENVRKRRLSDEEATRLLRIIEASPHQDFRVAIWLHLLTAFRPGEVMRIKWDLVDSKECRITVQDTKNGLDHTLNIHPHGIMLLNTLPRTSEYVFPTESKFAKSKHGHRKTFRKQWDTAREEADLPEVRLHDLRRTVGSMMRRNGVPIDIIAKVSNHKDSHVTERVYADMSNIDDTRVKEALHQHTERLLALVKDESPATVEP